MLPNVYAHSHHLPDTFPSGDVAAVYHQAQKRQAVTSLQANESGGTTTARVRQQDVTRNQETNRYLRLRHPMTTAKRDVAYVTVGANRFSRTKALRRYEGEGSKGDTCVGYSML